MLLFISLQNELLIHVQPTAGLQNIMFTQYLLYISIYLTHYLFSIYISIYIYIYLSICPSIYQLPVWVWFDQQGSCGQDKHDLPTNEGFPGKPELCRMRLYKKHWNLLFYGWMERFGICEISFFSKSAAKIFNA